MFISVIEFVNDLKMTVERLITELEGLESFDELHSKMRYISQFISGGASPVRIVVQQRE